MMQMSSPIDANFQLSMMHLNLKSDFILVIYEFDFGLIDQRLPK